MIYISVLIYLLFLNGCLVTCRPTEDERVKLWKEKNTWPPNWQEESDHLKEILAKREIEIMNIPGADERWENWLQFTQQRLVPKFTENGFLLAQTPKEVHEKLYNTVINSVKNFDNIPLEGDIPVITHPDQLQPKFVHIGSLAWETLRALKPLHEQWSGLELEPTSAYGVRLYQNHSTLTMHYDRIQTHVISAIVHIAHEYDNDNEPWPIQIEDHEGNLHSVNLEPGQMLFYESAKCLHGRMKKFKGKYYGSIFLHYRPVDKSIWNFSIEDVIAAVPPHWKDDIQEEKGSRYSGASMTIDSRITEGLPPRVVNGVVQEVPVASNHSEL